MKIQQLEQTLENKHLPDKSITLLGPVSLADSRFYILATHLKKQRVPPLK